ncbi:MAG: ribbon-helix-helix domain-containing protein [Verrucomicrobiales bacterium]|jgi:hypothetical protein|nr:ribbon-helix-helix domain-containing protein [Verrucomicrobiales bacterium]
MKNVLKNVSIMPIRLDPDQVKQLNKFKIETGLSKSFIIRRCIAYALQKIISGEVNILTLTERK